MNNHFGKMEQCLRAIAKRYKNIKFSIGMTILFLMIGVNAFSEEILTQEVANQQEIMSNEQIALSRENLRNSVGSLQSKIDTAKTENEKSLAGLRLELIQLMEQGNQVVKSPWASWQFGANYMYSKWNGTYKGSGDKSQKYAFEGMFVRGQWWENNVSPDSKAYSKLQLSSSGKNSSLTSKRQNLDYGLIGTVHVVDTGVPFIIEPVININTPPLPNLSINPVAINPNIRFNIPKVNTMSFEEIAVNKIEPNVFEPPALNEVSTGFAQGQEVGLNTNQNYIVSNSSVNLVDNEVNIKIKDTGYEGSGKFSWDGHSDTRSRSNRAADGGVYGSTDPSYNYIHTDINPPISSEYSSNGIFPGYGFFDDSITRVDKKFPMNTNWRPTTDPNYRAYGPSSQQVFLNILTDGFNLDGAGKTLKFENHTSEPKTNTSNGLIRTNTVRVISVNHAYGSVNKTIEFNLNADLKIFGRDGYNDKMTTANPKNTGPAPHMTIGIEHQAYGSIAARAINKGTMTLEKESKKTNGLATYMIGMTAMIEDYGDFGHQYSPDDSNANDGIDRAWYLGDGDTDATGVSSNKWKYRRQAPWESTLENRGTIKVNSIDSIGMDFAEYTFRADIQGTMYQSDNISGPTPNPKGKLPSYNNKGSLNIYARVGDIELNSEDPDATVNPVYSGIQGSYGLRVPNIFKTADNSQIYYDETVIDGSLNTPTSKGIAVNGSHNVGVSISKLITGSERVRKYQAGELGAQPADGTKAYLVARPNTDPIGNIYKLNILLNGTENVGLLRKSDYMQGSKYDLNNFMATGLTRAKNDFVITDSHVEKIDFSKDAKGGVLFRSDKYGIDLAKDNFVVTAMESRNKDTSGHDMYNIVMLANGSVNGVVVGAPAEDNLDVDVPVKVQNTKPIQIGATGNTGYNMIGLMAYKGGEFQNKANITLNTKNSIALVVEGEATRGSVKKESLGVSTNSSVKVTGDGSIGVYNNGRTYTMNGGEIDISGEKNVGLYAAGIPTYDHLGNITGYSNLATTTLNNGSLKVAGKGSVGLYANGGSDIKLNNMTNMLVKENALLFYGIKHNTDYSQLELVGNNSATIKKGAYAFYFKNENLLDRVVKSGSTGKIYLTLEDGATLSIIEGDGTTPILLSNIPDTTLNTSGDYEIEPGIVIRGTSGNYITTKSTKVNLQMNIDSNLDNKNDRYLNSEFASSSITLLAGKTISGSGALTIADTSDEKVKKSKVAIAQSNVGSSRSTVKLTNNGTINFTGTDMAGIVGEYSEINNNSIINVTGDNSTGIISANGAIATNSGTIKIGNGGTGLAGINYLGVTDATPSTIPTYGNQSIELVHNGSIVSTGNTAAIGVLASDLKSVTISGTTHNITNANAAKITLGNASTIDVSSATGGVGVYSKGILRNSLMAKVTDNGSAIKLNTDGIGLYLDGTELTATAGSIESINNTTAKGIYTDSNVNSAKNITLFGDKSIAIHNFGKNSQYGTNNIDISNSGNIKLGDSSDRNDPSIAIYTKYASVNHSGTIETGNRSLGIFSETPLSLTSNGSVKVGNEGLGVYKKQGVANINGTIETGNSGTAVYADNNVTVNNNSTNIKVGDNSFGFIVLDNGTNNYSSSSTSNFTMGSKSVYLYKTGANGVVNSATSVNSNGISSTAFYAKDGARITNTGVVNFANSVGSVGAYASGGEVYNAGTINVGASDIENNYYAIGMAAQNGGKIYNNVGSTIKVTGNYGIGMFAEGAGSRAENHGTIDISGNGELKGAYGMYLNNGAYGLNQGTIKTGRYGNDSQKTASFGVAVMNGAILENRGTIDIDMTNSFGVYIKNGIIKNYGTINISGAGSIGIRNKDGKDEHGNPITDANLDSASINVSNGANNYINESSIGPQPAIAGNTMISPTGVVTIDGKVVPIHDLSSSLNPTVNNNFAFSNVGIYIDTLGRTNPINWTDGFNPSTDNDLIIGAEAAELSTSKAIKIGKNIMSPYLREYQTLAATTRVTLNAISGSLTWTAQQIPGDSGLPEEVIMAKIPYTDFVTKEENAWNFADGLEQRYGVEAVGSREKEVFNKLNSIGKNERVLLTQAYDEMMGHQYANTQQRVYATGTILNTEFDYLRNEWRTASKDSNKIKTFGTNGEYNTDTAGVIDYKYNAYGVAYVHESEDIKLGRGIGWYTGIVHNTFKFKDIGNSKEKQLQAKFGLLKSVPFDDNNSLNWTISGDIFVGYNKMHRKFLVVNEIFNAKSKYYTYGIGIKNEIGKEFRLSESFTLRPYGALRLEYGKISKIKEKSGEIKLEVKNTDYVSVKPEIGAQLGFKHYLGNKLFTTSLGVAYENELGRLTDGKNKGRVANTTADWFNIRGEKDDRKGNVKTDLTFGLDNTRVGVTANVGYDTKGENLRGGLGLRVIF